MDIIKIAEKVYINAGYDKETAEKVVVGHLRPIFKQEPVTAKEEKKPAEAPKKPPKKETPAKPAEIPAKEKIAEKPAGEVTEGSRPGWLVSHQRRASF